MSDRGERLVLVTRPEPGGRETATLLRSLGYIPLVAPMLTVAYGRIAFSREPQAVMVTSANAIPALPQHLYRTPLFAVGDATAAKARACGFLQVESAGRDAVSLAALVARRCDPKAGPLLLACGAGQGQRLTAELRVLGYTLFRRIAYRTRPMTELPKSVISPLAEGRVMAAMFFSAATASAFAACMMGRSELVAGVEALAISQPTARALQDLPWRRIRVASHPNQDELVALLS